jgi:hypothetical protein
MLFLLRDIMNTAFIKMQKMHVNGCTTIWQRDLSAGAAGSRSKS